MLELEGIDCHYAKGGTIQLARSPVQLDRARAEIAEAREFGFGEDDLRLLSAAEAGEITAASDVLGGVYTVISRGSQVERVFRLAGIDRALPLFLSRQDAVDAVQNGGGI